MDSQQRVLTRMRGDTFSHRSLLYHLASGLQEGSQTVFPGDNWRKWQQDAFMEGKYLLLFVLLFVLYLAYCFDDADHDDEWDRVGVYVHWL